MNAAGAVRDFMGRGPSVVKEYAAALNHATHPGWTVVQVTVLVGMYLIWDRQDKLMVDQKEQRQLKERAMLRSRFEPKCLEQGSKPACGALMALDKSEKSKITLMDSAYYAPVNYNEFVRPVECHPQPTDASDSCWQPGPAIAAVGFTKLSVLMVQQAITAYSEVERRLSQGAFDLGAVSELGAFVRETIDLNKDGSLTRFEMLAGVSRLVHPNFWHETHLNLLWKWPS